MSPLDQPHAIRNSPLDGALDLARAEYAATRPLSAAIHARARDVLAGGNTRSVLFWRPFPTAMAGGAGARLTDADGHAYIDLLGEYTAGLFGHSEHRILDAVKAALDRGVALSGVGSDEAAFAAALVGRFASIERVRFTNSGTEANLMALAAARAFTGRVGVLGFRGGYHGGVLSFGETPGPSTVPIPLTLVDYNDTEAAVGAIHAAGDTLAAVLVEPMLGSGGCIPARPGFLAALRAATSATGALLVFDEVMTSRHHAGGMQARMGVTPDLTTLGKYIAGGMPIGAFGGRREVMDVFDGHRDDRAALPHAGTFNNNVASMAAGRVAMGELFDAAAADALFARGEALRSALNDACARAGVPMRFMGAGSMLAPHFAGPVARPAAPNAWTEGLRELFFLDLLAAGIYVARRGMLALSLPVTEADCATCVAAVERFLIARGPLLREVAP